MEGIYEVKRRKLHSLELRMKKLLDEQEKILGELNYTDSEDVISRLAETIRELRDIRNEVRIEIGEE